MGDPNLTRYELGRVMEISSSGPGPAFIFIHKKNSSRIIAVMNMVYLCYWLFIGLREIQDQFGYPLGPSSVAEISSLGNKGGVTLETDVGSKLHDTQTMATMSNLPFPSSRMPPRKLVSPLDWDRTIRLGLGNRNIWILWNSKIGLSKVPCASVSRWKRIGGASQYTGKWE